MAGPSQPIARSSCTDFSISSVFAVGGKKIVVCTIQTFPFALQEVMELSVTQGKRFAVIADEAHSSKTGGAASKLKQVLTAGELKDLEDGGEVSTEDILRQRVELRYRFIEMEKGNFTLVDLCRVMRVSRSGYYAWRQREPDPDRARRMALVQNIQRQKRGSYGSRRMARELQRCGEPVGRNQVRSLMREAGVEARQRRRWRSTPDSEHEYPVVSTPTES